MLTSESWLLQAEAENNLMLGVARSMVESASTDSESYWVTVTRDGNVVGAAFRTPPHPLVISRLPAEALSILLEDVADVYSDLTGVSGPNTAAEHFADLWVDRFGGSWRVEMRQRIHALTVLNELTETPTGRLRRMEPFDTELILQWMEQFVQETGIRGTGERFARPHLQRRNFYVWEDNGPRSVAAVLRDSPTGACISAVYTPPVHRRNGYGTATVAALSRLLLQTGKKFSCLYTDLANPTSNAIYRKVGYAPVRDDVVLAFEPG